MRYIADFHIHSKYSRATSPKMDLENISAWCQKKGINIVTCADFTHPKWFKELKEKLVLNESGLYSLKPGVHPPTNNTILKNCNGISLTDDISATTKNKNRVGGGVNFILTTEISCIYSKGGKCRRLHVLIFAPTLEVVEKINEVLGKIGNLKADGRPILGLDAKRLAEIVFEISEDCLIIPAHAWTPWFSVFGSKSGFDSLKECFEELTPKICAIETGLSSDPAMNWRLKQLDNITLISNSDAHSLEKLGREVNVFDINTEHKRNINGTITEPVSHFLQPVYCGKELNLYKEIVRILREKDKKSFLYTVEFFPEEGKYHYDGCVNCRERMSPQETKKHDGLCPKCRKKVTVGVLSRVDDLADRKEGEKPKNFIPFKNLVPLTEIIAGALGSAVSSKRVKQEYENLISKHKNEFNILLDESLDALTKSTFPAIVEGIKRVRESKLIIEPGYDGVYGIVKVFSEEEVKGNKKQTSLF